MSQLILDPERFSVQGDELVIKDAYVMGNQAYVQDYPQVFPDNNSVPSWNRGKPRFMRFLDMILSPLQDAMDVLNNYDDAFSIDKAVGKQLDIIGELLGCSRVLPVVFSGYSSTLDNDDDYRMLIRATIARQHWDGTLKGMIDTINSLFQNLEPQIIDNYNGSFSLKIKSTQHITGIQMQMILSDLLFPHAAGIKMTVQIPSQIQAAQVGLAAGVYEIGHDVMTAAGGANDG